MKKKMKLEGLKVKSFVTKVEKANEETVKGGKPQPLTGPIQITTKRTLAEPGCPWWSELYTACTCPPSWQGGICSEV